MSNLTYKNLRLHYTDKGSGHVILFLHGFLEELGMWDPIAAAFEKTHRVITMDLLGHGETGNLGYVHDMEAQAEMISFLLDRLKISDCVLIGHSMGGYVALAFAEHFPKKVSGLCLMNSTALADTDEKKINRDRGIDAVKHNHKTFVRVAIPGLFSEENRSVFTNEIEQITQKALKMSQQGIIAALEGMKVRKDRSHLLEQHDFSVLMVIGRQDPALDFESLLEQSRREHVETVIFEDGHMSHIENEKALVKVLSQWSPIKKSAYEK